ncbi:alpha/beta fold hydrolase [Acinetobacter junii]|uniref:alpha/beta fold hydrolase n=1 Tax=Acinetobacter junii TaxID=40215 RepID=UPI0032124B95
MTLFTTVADAKVAYSVDGEGSANLVLVHGAGGNSESNWGHLVQYLSPYYKVVRPNFSGSGETTDNGEELSTVKLAEQVVAAAKAANAVPFDLIAFSLGTSVATYIAAEYPELVKSVVLLSAFIVANPRHKLQLELWKSLTANDHYAMSSLLILTGFSPNFVSTWDEMTISNNIESMITTNNWSGLARQIELGLNTDVTEQARKITKPTLVIGGKYDGMVPSESTKHTASLISGAEYTELESGHMAIYEKAEEFLQLATAFLQKNA